MATRKTVLGLAEDMFNWTLHVKSIYMSYKLIRWHNGCAGFMAASKQTEGERERELLRRKRKVVQGGRWLYTLVITLQSIHQIR